MKLRDFAMIALGLVLALGLTGLRWDPTPAHADATAGNVGMMLYPVGSQHYLAVLDANKVLTFYSFNGRTLQLVLTRDIKDDMNLYEYQAQGVSQDPDLTKIKKLLPKKQN